METYTLRDILAPWIQLILILIPLIYTEQWIHQHAFGIGYLVSGKDEMAATRLFYVFFLPGVFIHEFVQYLVAGALSVPIKKVVGWPEKQKNGTLRLNFIVVQRDKIDPIRAAFVAAAPFLLMSLIVWYISTQRLDLDNLGKAFGTGEPEIIGDAFGALFDTSNFVLWTYLLFVIANAMVPKAEDAYGWPLILGIVGIISVVMIVVGLDSVLMETMGGPVTTTLRRVNTALVSILGLNFCAIVILGLIEDAIEYFRGERMDYSGGESLTKSLKEVKRIPGSDAPYPAGQPLPSIYNFHLPIPEPGDRPVPKKETPEPAITARETSRFRELEPSGAPSLAGFRAQREEAQSESSAAPGADRPRVFGARDTSEQSAVKPAESAAESPTRSRLEDLRARRETGQLESSAAPGADRPHVFGARDTSEKPAVKPSESAAESPTRSRLEDLRARRETGQLESPAAPGSDRPRDFGARDTSEKPAVRPTDQPARPTGTPPPSAAPGDARSRLEEFRARRDQPESERSPADRPARPAGITPGSQPSDRPAGFRPAPRPGDLEQERKSPASAGDDDLHYEDFDEPPPPEDDFY